MFKESRMGITMFGIQGLLAPLQSLMDWVAGAPRARTMDACRQQFAHAAAPVRACAPRSAVGGSCRERAGRPLRVVRVMDASLAAAGAGRMVISGRMADVCAELDRLAALEAAAG
jgi:hypothetical protein